jgi:integrase
MLKRHMLTNKKFLADDEQQALLLVLERYKNQPKAARDITLLYTLFLTGARAGEALALVKEDLISSHTSVYLKGSKDSNSREIPIPPWLFRRLQAQITGTRPLFPISYNRLDQIWRHYRPINKKLHSLRHTFAINLYRKTLNIRMVQKALGHRYLSNTMIYLDYDFTVDELRKALC